MDLASHSRRGSLCDHVRGLHIEMATLKLLGDWLEDSGWTNALVQAGIASLGTSKSYINVSHVTKTRHAHQVTAASLYTLLQQA